ncbi:MAG: SPASM domain-containing protein [Desulfobacterota bacterium]|nr:SPASM domain-containing protein [Thermodesulfobacteriota bacterium]
MQSSKRIFASVDNNGNIVIPKKIALRLGVTPHVDIPLTELQDGIVLHRSATHIAKIYLEPTNRCNLACRTCIRNTWDEPQGDMSSQTFEKILSSLKTFDRKPLVFFGGLGEPLAHPAFLDMLRRIQPYASSIEMITNGTLLDQRMVDGIVAAGIDVVWLSLDGAHPESYADVRLGAALPQVLENAARLRDVRSGGLPHLGIVFVAMRRNIAELPEVIRIGNRLGVDRFLITNIIPYTASLQDEMLYGDTMTIPASGMPSPIAPQVQFTRMDITVATAESLFRLLRSFRLPDSLPTGLPLNYCPFIESGACAVSWNGTVSPCLPLLHTHSIYVDGRRRIFRVCSMGNINQQPLLSIWNTTEYVAFRKRVQQFDFSPCTFCGGCHLSRSNDEDCLGNTFPVCGGCLWSQGLIRCP